MNFSVLGSLGTLDEILVIGALVRDEQAAMGTLEAAMALVLAS
jgi:hypothetical protein